VVAKRKTTTMDGYIKSNNFATTMTQARMSKIGLAKPIIKRKPGRRITKELDRTVEKVKRGKYYISALCEEVDSPLGKVTTLPSRERVLKRITFPQQPDLTTLSDEEILLLEREIGMHDLFYFARNICGFSDMTEAHRKMCEFPSKMTKPRALILLPRGFFKSSIITCAYALQRIVQDRRVRILLMGETDKKIKKYLAQIKTIIEHGREFRRVFGNLIPPQEKGWKEDEITVRDRWAFIKEPTIACTGVAKPMTGMHYDLIIIDDPHSERNTQTRDQIQKVIDAYKLLSPILEPEGKMIVIGCLAKDTKILMADGRWKEITDIAEGDRVLSYREQKMVEQRVAAVVPQGEDEVFEIRTKRHCVKANRRHPFLVVTGSDTRDVANVASIEWKKVEDLKVGDRVVTIADADLKGQAVYHPDGRLLDESFFFLLGYLFGDGWIIKTKKRWHGYAVAQSAYLETDRRILDSIRNWFCKEGKLDKRRYYRFEDAPGARWLATLGLAGGARGKRMPEWIFSLSSSLKRAFIEGLLRADGSRLKGGQGSRLEIVNKKLIEDVYWLSLTCGYRPGRILQRERVCYPPSSSGPVRSAVFSVSLCENKRQEVFSHNWRWDRITSIAPCGKEQVYDLSIEGAPTFLANGYVVHNTRWHHFDLFGYIMENESRFYDIYVEKAIKEDGSLLFPERLSREHLDRERIRLGGAFWSMQYQNEVRDEETAEFRREWIRRYRRQDESRLDVPIELPGVLTTFTTVDPSISIERTGDFSAIVTVGVDNADNWYVLEAKRLKANPAGLIDAVFHNYHRWKPTLIGLEVVSFQKALSYTMKEEMKKRNLWLPLRELKTDTSVGKSLRIRSLIPRFENGKIYIHPEMIDLEEELLSFPRGRHDDLLDALAYQNQIVFAPGSFSVTIAGTGKVLRPGCVVADRDKALPVAR